MRCKVTGEGDDEDDVPKKHCNFRLYTVTFEPRHEKKLFSMSRVSASFGGSQLLSDFQTFFCNDIINVIVLSMIYNNIKLYG